MQKTIEIVKKPTLYIWLVDDDPIANIINQKSISIHFPQSKIQVFQSPLDAFETLVSRADLRPNFILLDLNMPLMEGWEFLDGMGKKGIDVPVVILTSSFYEEDEIRAQGYRQVCHFMTKPINMEELKRVL